MIGASPDPPPEVAMDAANDTIFEVLRVLSNAYREDQKLFTMQQLLREIKFDPHKRRSMRSVALHKGNSQSGVFTNIFKAAQGTFNVKTKMAVLDLTVTVATDPETTREELEHLASCGVSPLVLDIFAFTKAYKAPEKMVEDALSLIVTFVPVEGAFTDEFVRSGGSKILFSQLVANYTSEVPRQSAARALRQLAANTKYLKPMSESGGISSLIESLAYPCGIDFYRDALRIISTVCSNNIKLLSTLMQNDQYITNILKMLRINDIGILQETLFIVCQLSQKELNSYLFHVNGAFREVNEVMKNEKVTGNPRLLVYALTALHQFMRDEDSMGQFMSSGNQDVLKTVFLKALDDTVPSNHQPEDAAFEDELEKPPPEKHSPKRKFKAAAMVVTLANRLKREEDEASFSFAKNSKTDSKSRVHPGSIVKAAMKVLDRLGESRIHATTVGLSYLLTSLLKFFCAIPLQDMGVTSRNTTVMYSNATQANEMNPQSMALFELVAMSLNLLAKYCSVSKENASTLPRLDKFTRLLNCINPGTQSNARSLRLAMLVLSVLDVITDHISTPEAQFAPSWSEVTSGLVEKKDGNVLPFSNIMGMIVVTSLCELLETISVQHNKSIKLHTQINTDFESKIIHASLRLIKKLSVFPDLLQLIADQLPLEKMRYLFGLTQEVKGSDFQERAKPFTDPRANLNQQQESPEQERSQESAVPSSPHTSDSIADQVHGLVACLSVSSPSLKAQLESLGFLDAKPGKPPPPKKFMKKKDIERRFTKHYDVPALPERPYQYNKGENDSDFEGHQDVIAARPSKKTFKYMKNERYFTYSVGQGETLADVAKTFLNDPSRWPEILLEGGHIPNEVDAFTIAPFSVVWVPELKSSMLTQSQKEALVRTNSLPEIHKIINPKASPSIRARSAGFRSDSGVGSGELKKRRRNSMDEESASQSIVEAQLRELGRRLRAEMSRVHRECLMVHQDIRDEEESEFNDLSTKFRNTCNAIEGMMRARKRFTELAVEERIYIEMAELDSREELHIEIFEGTESADRAMIMRFAEARIQSLFEQNNTEFTEHQLRLELWSLQAIKYYEIYRPFEIGILTLREQSFRRKEVERDEHVARDTLRKELNIWVNQITFGLQFLKLRYTESMTRRRIVKEFKEFIELKRGSFLWNKLQIIQLEEDDARWYIMGDETVEATELQHHLEVLGVIHGEWVKRQEVESASRMALQDDIMLCASTALELLIKEENSVRSDSQMKFWGKIWVFHHHRLKINVQAAEVGSRIVVIADIWQQKTKLFRQFYRDACQIVQNDEERRRGIAQSQYNSSVLRLTHHSQRVCLTLGERMARADISKDALQSLKSTHNFANKLKIPIATRDVFRFEPVFRDKLEKQQWSAFWYLKTSFVTQAEETARGILTRNERREWTRVGQGMKDFLHLYELDRMAQYFDPLRPNSVMLIPFIVPVHRLKHARAQNAEAQARSPPRSRVSSAKFRDTTLSSVELSPTVRSRPHSGTTTVEAAIMLEKDQQETYTLFDNLRKRPASASLVYKTRSHPIAAASTRPSTATFPSRDDKPPTISPEMASAVQNLSDNVTPLAQRPPSSQRKAHAASQIGGPATRPIPSPVQSSPARPSSSQSKSPFSPSLPRRPHSAQAKIISSSDSSPRFSTTSMLGSIDDPRERQAEMQKMELELAQSVGRTLRKHLIGLPSLVRSHESE